MTTLISIEDVASSYLANSLTSQDILARKQHIYNVYNCTQIIRHGAECIRVKLEM